MYRTIMVPLDGSALAERALPLAEALAARGGGRLILMRAVVAHPFPAADAAEQQRQLVQEAAHYLSGVASRFDACLQVECAVAYGDAAQSILAEARLRDVNLVVMATHGRGGLGRWLYGSVADQVLRQAGMPVALVPAACDHTWDRSRPMRVVVPLDGSDFALEALGAVRALAHMGSVDVALLRVVEPVGLAVYAREAREVSFAPEEQLAVAQRYLERMAATLEVTAREVSIHVALGTAPSEIAALACEEGADLVVMATHGRGGLSRLVMGSTATGTLHRVHTPLLLVRPQGLRIPTAEAERVIAWPRVHAPTPAMASTASPSA